MASTRVDLIVFGATGFTGKFVVDEMASKYESEGFTWAIAGRDNKKLRSLLDTVATARGTVLKLN